MTTNRQMDQMIRDKRSAPPVTVGGEPDESSSSMRLTRWMQAEARARSGEIPTEEVMSDYAPKE